MIRRLWEAVLHYLRAGPGESRRDVFARFARDAEADVGAVLKDLVDSGLVSRTGRGDQAFYQVVGSEAVSAMVQQQSADAIESRIWLLVYDQRRVQRGALLAELPFEREAAERAIDALVRDGRVERELHDGSEFLACRQLSIPVGSEQGWETAVFDHFRAAATAIASKLQRIGARSDQADMIGGATLTFSIYRGHPAEHEVYGLLARVRAELNPLWQRVAAQNKAQPIDPGQRVDLTFYFGQNVVPPEPDRSGC